MQLCEHSCTIPRLVVVCGATATLAGGWGIRVPPRLHLTTMREGIVHARGAAAITQNLVTWQRVQDDFVTPIRKLLPSERDIARLM